MTLTARILIASLAAAALGIGLLVLAAFGPISAVGATLAAGGASGCAAALVLEERKPPRPGTRADQMLHPERYE